MPANYYEKQIESQRDAIVKAKQEDDQILKQYKYALYDFSGNLIQGSINKDYAGQIWNNIHNDEKGDSKYYYAVIERDKDICVILYTLHATFKILLCRSIYRVRKFVKLFFYSTICCRSDISISLFW